MNVTRRLLELDGEGMHPFQVGFIRMWLTDILCWAYMWYTRVPYFPLGKKEVSKLLIIRGLSGFFAIFKMCCKCFFLNFQILALFTGLSRRLSMTKSPLRLALLYVTQNGNSALPLRKSTV